MTPSALIGPVDTRFPPTNAQGEMEQFRLSIFQWIVGPFDPDNCLPLKSALCGKWRTCLVEDWGLID